MDKHSQSVCIVGAGPAGLIAALTLLQKGILSQVFERSASHRVRSRATGLQADTLRILDSLGIGKVIRQKATPVYGSYISFNRQFVRRLAFVEDRAGPCDNLSINQADTEAIVLAELEHVAGLKVVWNTAVQLYGRKLKLSGRNEIISPDIIIAADGGNGKIRDSAGLVAEKTMDNEISFCCDATMAPEEAIDHTHMHQMFSDSGRVVFVPLPGQGRFKISGTFSKNIARKSVPDEAALRVFIHERSGVSLKGIDDIFLYRLCSLRASQLGKDNVVLVGDAAQTFYPNGGFGLNTAIQQAHSLAEIIADGSENFLPRYQTEWEAKIAKRFAVMNALRCGGG